MFCTFWLVNVLGATAACHFSTIFRHLHFKKWPESVSFLRFWLEHVPLATAACNFSTSQLQKVVRARQFFSILTWKCTSRYSGVQFFHIATSKSGPNLTCFVHFDLKMCFSLQRRAIFPHRNFKKWSEHVARGTFWLKMCFSLQRRAIFHVFPQQPPPHPPLYRGYFSTQPTHKSLKNTAFRDFPNILRNCSFFLLTFAQLYLLSSDSTSLLCFFIFWLCYSALLFQLSILSEVRLLNFLRLFQWSLTYRVCLVSLVDFCGEYEPVGDIPFSSTTTMLAKSEPNIVSQMAVKNGGGIQVVHSPLPMMREE